MKGKRKRKTNFSLNYVFVAVGVFLLSVILAYFTRMFLRTAIGLSADEAGLLTSMLEAIIASIAIAQVLHQMKRGEEIEQGQNDIDEARFILEYNQSFIQDSNMTEVEALLEQQMEGNAEKSISPEQRQKCINYLVYLEGLAPLVLRDVLRLDHIDDLMAYRFFLAVNSPALQDDQLFRYPDYYLGCFKLYQFWKEYRLSKGKSILQSSTPLDRLFVREAIPSDNTQRIAELIYYTDPYIYPAAFENVKTAQNEFPYLGLFDLKNIIVAIRNGEFIGVAVVSSGENKTIDPEEYMANHKKLPESFRIVCREYFNQIEGYSENEVYIACLSVDKDHRNMGVGTALLEYVFQKFSAASVSLDVVDGNPAEKLYISLGFHIVSEHVGFALGKTKPKVKLLRRNSTFEDRKRDCKTHRR